jgi:hypothetical protein
MDEVTETGNPYVFYRSLERQFRRLWYDVQEVWDVNRQ